MMPELKALLLREPRWTVAAAESLTSGHVQALLGSISGSSDYYLGGVTAYSLEQKVNLLGVNRATAQAVNSVSGEVARQMALGALKLFSSDWAVATTGYAEAALTQGVEQPFAWWAVARRRGAEVIVDVGEIGFPDLERVAVQTQVATAVLGELLARVREARTGSAGASPA
ncbi:MAG TPA: CinA family protein [Opitutaceae bacterium]